MADGAEPDHGQRMTRQADHGAQQLGREGVRVADERPEQAPPGPAVGAAEAGGGGVDGAFEHGDPAAVERVRERGVGVDQRHAVPGEVDGPEERRGDGQRTTVEHRSWRNPGSVTSAVRVPPPMASAAS